LLQYYLDGWTEHFVVSFVRRPTNAYLQQSEEMQKKKKKNEMEEMWNSFDFSGIFLGNVKKPENLSLNNLGPSRDSKVAFS
jgi:hypothetical protein